MFKRRVMSISELVQLYLREEGLETPLMQKRLIDSWADVAGRVVARYTVDIFIKNQTLFVKIQNPALRADLVLMRTQLVKRLNDKVGNQVIADIKIY